MGQRQHHPAQGFQRLSEIEVFLLLIVGKQVVGHRLEGDEPHAVAQADLSNSASLHFHQQGREGIPDPLGTLTFDGEPVPGGDSAGDGGDALLLEQRDAPLRLPGGEGHLVDGGDQPDGVSYRGGVHVVLYEF